MSDRFYVTLTATCAESALPDVLADMQAAMRDLTATSSSLSGLSLSFSRDDAEEFSAETVSLPDASTPAPILPDPTPSTMGGASGPLPPIPEAPDAGQHAAPTAEPTA